MDRASAAHRSLVWLVGFIVVLVLPLISIIEPYWIVELPTVMQSEVSAPPLETAQVAQVSNEMANSFTPPLNLRLNGLGWSAALHFISREFFMCLAFGFWVRSNWRG